MIAIISLILCLLVGVVLFFITIKTKPEKVNKHGLHYELLPFAETHYCLAFWDENKKKLVWLLYIGINHDKFSYELIDYEPKLSKSFFRYGTEIDRMIDGFATIEDVYNYNSIPESQIHQKIDKHRCRINEIRKQREKYN